MDYDLLFWGILIGVHVGALATFGVLYFRAERKKSAARRAVRHVAGTPTAELIAGTIMVGAATLVCLFDKSNKSAKKVGPKS